MLLEPWWKNFFYNMATVQFDHRLVAWLLALLVPVFWWRSGGTPGAPARARDRCHHAARVARRADRARASSRSIHVVPLPLAAAHQAGALLVFAAALNLAHALR